MIDHDTLVSVLMCGASRPYLLTHRAIPSVLAQSHRNWELVIVSDGPHNSRAASAVAAFQDSRIRYHELPADVARTSIQESTRKRRAAAISHAEDLAKGDIYALLGETDEFLPDHLKDCVDALLGTGADLCYGKVRIADPNLGRYVSHYADWDSPDTRTRFAAEPVFAPSSVAFRAPWRNVPAGPDGSSNEGWDHRRWTALRAAGARFTSLATEQAVDHGSTAAPWVRISLPSLPPAHDVHTAVDTILTSRHVSNFGNHCRDFEAALSEYVGVPNVIATASGDTALGMAMTAVQRNRPDRTEVIVPSYTFPSTVNAVLRAGLQPVFCDVHPDSLTVTRETVEQHIGPRTAALLPVHAHGIPAHLPELEKLASQHRVLLVSDAAAALGAGFDSRKIGSFGDMEVFSLSATKVLTTGEGGAITCRDSELAHQLRQLGRYGLGADYECLDAGGVNGRMSELAAAMGRAGLPMLDSWLARRRDSAALYQKQLSRTEHLRLVAPGDSRQLPTWKDVSVVTPSASTAAHLAARLATHRIETRPYYRPLHRMRGYAGMASADLPVTDQVADRIISIPISNEIPDSTVMLVSEILLAEFEALHSTTPSATRPGLSD